MSNTKTEKFRAVKGMNEVAALGKSLAAIPTKVGALVHAIGGGERDPETPISVVGASSDNSAILASSSAIGFSNSR